MIDTEWDRQANELLGAGMLFGALSRHDGVSIEIVMDGDNATNAMLVKFDVGGPPAERGYLVTVTLPSE